MIKRYFRFDLQGAFIGVVDLDDSLVVGEIDTEAAHHAEFTDDDEAKHKNGCRFKFVNGEVQYEPMPLAIRKANINAKRATLYVRSDWTQSPLAELTEEQQSAWNAYRQALRDIPTQEGYPDNVVWPQAPDVAEIPVEEL